MRSFLFIYFLLHCFIVSGQKDTLQLSKRIDSLAQLGYSNYNSRDYDLYKIIIEDSKKIKYDKGVLKPQIEILKYYTAHPNIDSLFSYSQQFEKYHRLHPNKKLHIEYLKAMGYLLLYHFHLPEYGLLYYIEILKVIDDDDVKTKFVLSQGIADCYMYKGQYDLAIKQILKVIKDTTSVHDTAKNVMKVSLAIAYQFLEKPERSRPLLADVIHESTRNQDSLHYTYAKVFQGHNLYLEKEYQKSIDLLMTNFNLLKKYWPGGVVAHYEFLSLSYSKLGYTQKAASIMRKAIKKSPPNELPKLYDHLANYYIKLGKKDSALYYNTQKSQIIDSIRYLEKKIYTEFYETKIDFITTAEENEKIKQKQVTLSKANNRQKHYIISLFLSIVCLIIGIIYIVYYNKNKQSKKEINILKKSEKNILQHHIKIREDELSATHIGLTKKMQVLMGIRDQLCGIIDADTPGELRRPIKLLDHFLKNNTSNTILTERLESKYPGLVMQLKELYPELSKTNIRHCLLVKLEFSIKESAIFLNVNPNTVKTARYRAKSKLGLPEDMSLEEFLSRLESSSLMEVSSL